MKLLNYLVYALIAGFLAAGRIIPMRLTFGLAARLGRLAYRLGRNRRALALHNLELALGRETSPEQREEIARASFANLFIAFAEVLHYFPLHFVDHTRYFTFEGVEILEQYRRQKQGVFLISGHFGGWATMPLVPRFPEGPLMHMVARLMTNRYLQDLMDELAEPYHLRILTGRGKGSLIEEGAARGEWFCFWMDQEARRDQGLFVKFFGQDASTFAVPGYLAWKNSIPLVPYWVVRKEPGRFQVIIRPALRYELVEDKDENNRRVAQAIVAEVESMVRAHPEQWLWAHNRWRRRPDGTKIEFATHWKNRKRKKNGQTGPA